MPPNTRQLNYQIDSRRNNPEHQQAQPDLAIHHPLVERHCNEQSEQCHE